MHKFFSGFRSIGLFLFGLAVFLSVWLIVPAQADTTSPWLSASLNLQKDGDLPQGTPIPLSFSGNRDCIDHEFTTRPGSFPFSLSQAELKHSACGVQSNYGIVDPNGWLELNGTRIAGRLANYSSYTSGSIPVPASFTLINYTSGPSGLFLHFTKNLPGAITASTATNGEVTYQINRPGNISLRDKANTILPTQPDSLSFSGNGEWMIVDGRNRAVLRVNTETLEVLPFAPTFNYSIGLNPGLQTAITSDGRYAVVYSKNFGVFNLYDLSTCTAVPNSINAPVACQSRDLQPLMQQLPGLQSISRIRFINDDTLSFYANYYSTPGVPSTNKIGKFRLTSGPSTDSQIEFLALGDSYISGEGAFEYKAGTDISDNRCHLSVLSYPHLISRELSFNSFNSIACSGAKVPDILNDSDNYEGQVNDAFTRRNRDIEQILNSFQPGYINQLEFVIKHQPQRVLVNIGGNDIGFSKILLRCLEPDTCYSTYEDRLELVREINGRFPALVDAYTKIKQEGMPGAKIYAVGYPQIVLPGGSCDLNVRFNTQELEFARLITAYLDDVIKRASGRAGIGYADTQEALNGHRLCEAVNENIAVHGLTAGDNTPSFLRGPIGNESYHPNQLGHRLLSQTILSVTQNLAKSMPTPDSGSSPPTEDGLEILNAPKSNRPINRLNYDDDLANDIVYREVWWDIYLKSLNFSLKKLSPISIVLNSQPTSLGTFSTDPGGDLSAQIRIPANVPTGFHTLHVYGQNLANEPVDVYKTIYVAANESDYDADGLPNTTDPCNTLPNSGADRDQDGIDDACDGFIGESPVVVLSSNSNQNSGPTDSVPSSQNQEETSNNSSEANSTIQATAPTSMVQGTNTIDGGAAVELTLPGVSSTPNEQSPQAFDFESLNRPGLMIASLLAGLLALIASKSVLRTWRSI